MSVKHVPINNTIISGDRGSEPPKWVKIVVMCAILLGIFFFLLSLGSCNSSNRHRAEEAHIVVQDSAAVKQGGNVSRKDSSSNEEESSFHYQTGDSALDSELEIVMQRQKDYANGDSSTPFPPRPVYSDFVVDKTPTGYKVNSGGREIKSITVKDKKQGSKVDSSGVKKATIVAVSVFDSSHYKDSVYKAILAQLSKKESDKETKRVPLAMIIGAVVLILLLVAFLYYRKKAGVASKVAETIVEHLPEPAGIKKES